MSLNLVLFLFLQKSRKDIEEKRLVREGRNSLITYPNASSFSVFSHIRHFVLQTQLCETYNSQLGAESEGENEGEAEGEEGKGEVAKMPVVSRELSFSCVCGRGYNECVM